MGTGCPTRGRIRVRLAELLERGPRVEGDSEVIDGGDLPSQVGGGSGEAEVGPPASEGPPAGTPRPSTTSVVVSGRTQGCSARSCTNRSPARWLRITLDGSDPRSTSWTPRAMPAPSPDVVGDLAGDAARCQDRPPDEEARAGRQRDRGEQVQPSAR